MHKSLLDRTGIYLIRSGIRSGPLSMRGSVREGSEEAFWATEAENLKHRYAQLIRSRIEFGDLHHLSVFAIAPQPLLVLLGTLIGDITPADVFQRHREPPGWEWPATEPEMQIATTAGHGNGGPLALKIELSARIDDARVEAVLGSDADVWSISTPYPHNDVLKRKRDLEQFRTAARKVFADIAGLSGTGNPIHVFPAMPVAAAVELGRVSMPKADPPMQLWDENRRLGGFTKAIAIGGA